MVQWFADRHLASDFKRRRRRLRPQTKQQAGALALALAALATRQIRDVGVVGQRRRNVLGGLDTSDLDQAVARLRDRLADDVGGLGLSLGADDVGLPLLLGLFDDEARPLGVLLRDLLLLDGPRELAAEGHVRDGNVLEGDVELAGAFHEVGADAVGDGFTLRDELGGVELGDYGFQDFVADRGKDSLIVVEAKVLLVLGCVGEESAGSHTW